MAEKKMWPDHKGKRVVCSCTHIWQAREWPHLNDAGFLGCEKYKICKTCGRYPWIYNKRGAFQKYKRKQAKPTTT